MLPVTPTPVEDKEGRIWVCVSPLDYLNNAENMLNILTHIRQQGDVVRYYESCVGR